MFTSFGQIGKPPVYLFCFFGKSRLKNQVRQTGFLVYFKLDCYYICSKVVCKNPIQNWRKSSTEQQSYEIKSPPWTILWFRILGIFSVENIKRLCVFIFQTWDNSQLLRRALWIIAELTIVSCVKHKITQPLYIFNRVRVLHLDRLKEGTWLHSFEQI